MKKDDDSSVMSLQEIIQRKTNDTTKDLIAYIMIGSSGIFWVGGFVYSNQNNLAGSQTCLSLYTVMVITSYISSTIIKSPWNVNKSPGLIKLILRNCIFLGHALVCSIVQFYIPLNVFHILGCTGPIFTFIANYLVNGIRATKQQIIGVSFTFIGLVLAINGKLLYSMIDKDYKFSSDFQNYRTQNTYVQIMVCLLYLVWTFIWSFALIFTKIPQFNSAQMMFTTGDMGTICYGIDLNFYQQKSHPIIYYKSLLWVGLPLSIASYLFTVGFKLASNAGKASTILVVGNAVIGFMMSFFRYDQGLNVFVLFRALIILGSVVVVVRSNNYNSSKAPENSLSITQSVSKYSDI